MVEWIPEGILALAAMYSFYKYSKAASDLAEAAKVLKRMELQAKIYKDLLESIKL